jgi:hypothetical protein
MPKKVKFAGTRWLSKKRPKQKRIRIGQPPDRPLKVFRKQPDKMRQARGDLVVHRRLRRPKVGLDYQESRAVQGIKGTLPERIMYKALVQRGYKPGVDFDFQSSQSGGRMQMGGIVADFLFPFKKIVIQVQGPTHAGFLRAAKDQEQRELLDSMGYTTLEVDQDVILSASKLDAWLRNNIDICLFAGVESVETVASFQKHTEEAK